MVTYCVVLMLCKCEGLGLLKGSRATTTGFWPVQLILLLQFKGTTVCKLP
jgi:hypothetical protein